MYESAIKDEIQILIVTSEPWIDCGSILAWRTPLKSRDQRAHTHERREKKF